MLSAAAPMAEHPKSIVAEPPDCPAQFSAMRAALFAGWAAAAAGIIALLAEIVQNDLRWAPLVLFPAVVGVILGGVLVGIARLVQAGHRPTLVSIILDGENCWEYYPNAGVDFLRGVYRGVVKHPKIKPMRVADYLERWPAGDKIGHLVGAGCDLGHVDPDAEIEEGAGDGVENPDAVGGVDLEDGVGLGGVVVQHDTGGHPAKARGGPRDGPGGDVGHALLAEEGLDPGDLKEVIMAGAFGTYVDPADALAIALLPPVPLESITQVGNAAGSGARSMLLSRNARREAEALAERIEYLELSAYPRLGPLFAADMYLTEEAVAAAKGRFALGRKEG